MRVMFSMGVMGLIGQIFWIIFLTGCGNSFTLGLGGGGSLNDPTPTGVLRGQGTFSGQNGQSVSGTASIYLSTSDTSYVLRLAGLSTPQVNGLLVQVTTNSGGQQPAQTFGLRGFTGNQNYTLSIPIGSVVANVTIYNPSAASGTGTYGVAQIISTNSGNGF